MGGEWWASSGSVRKNATSRGPPLPCNNFRRKIHDNRDYCRLCEFRMQVCLRHSSSTALLLAETLFSSTLYSFPLVSFFFCQRDLSSALLRANPSFPSLLLTEPPSSSRISPLLPFLVLVDPNDVRGGPREAELDK